MGNESKTENIVREALGTGYEKCLIEEKKSDIPKIDKLLKNASKKGNGCGYPDFIITSKEHSDFLIVIECKADIQKHKSETRDKYADYAVDGALLYASFLSKEYDVLAIAISGETKKELKVSHFFQLCKKSEYHDCFKNQILPFKDYHEGILKSEQKFNQDYEKIILYTKELNELLHEKKIKEADRAMLISGILLALKNEGFKSSYNKHNSIMSLINSLYSTICHEIEQSDVGNDIQKRLKNSFAFINTNPALTNKDNKNFVSDLIKDIDQKINGFMQTYKYIDTVSQFYVEFLRYANNDKGLGIVLTPAHITELFVELAEVNHNSVVFDNCCGTGGFLISAMKKMIEQAAGDKTKENNIKKNQLVGIEYQDDICALAISNMILHRDGRTNIILGDCFETKVPDKFKINVGLLNPPYKTKKSDIEELEFVLNNLERLEQDGKCVAIIPLSCVIERTAQTKELKERLLKQHTLEGVMSLPEELFHNSKVNVVTCALVITAKKPHPKGKKTWFGYWRNDGFVKVKNKGRIDKNETWQETKNKWVNAFKNKEHIPEMSLMQEVSANDEWCAEAYMKTDYSKLTKEDYEITVKKFILFNFMNSVGNENNEEENVSDE